MRYYGVVTEGENQVEVQSKRPRNILIFSVVAACAIFYFVATRDPFREVRELNPLQSWGDENLVDRTMPDDIVCTIKTNTRVFKFTQDPLVVFSKVGGESKYLQIIRDSFTAIMSTSFRGKVTFEHDNGMEIYGLPVKLRSGREAEFFTIPKSSGGYTCKLVIRPLTQFGFQSILDWIIR